MIAGIVFATRRGGGGRSVVDRTQALVPAVSNQGGGLIWPFVNLWSGNLILDYPAIRVPAVGLGWELDFHYNAILSAETTTLGAGWRHSYEVALVLGAPDPTSITVRWGDGRRDVFAADGNGWAGPPALHGMRITQLPPGGYELRDKHGFVHAFDAAGLLVARRDRNGNTMAFAYAAGRVSAVTDASGRSCQFEYDPQGRLVTITGLQHSSPLATLEYQGDLLIRVRDVAGNPCDFAYDPNQLLRSVTDPEGDGITVDYHASLPVVVGVTTTGGAERRFAYDQSLLETTVTDLIAQGQESIIGYRFDAAGRVVSVTDGPLGTTQNTYDGANNLLTHTDADGRVTSMTYSAAGDLLTVTDPIQATRSYTYDPVFHLVMSETDEGMNTWSAQRDANGNLTRWADPLGNHDDYTYSAQGLVTSHTDRRGNTTAFGYNANGDLVLVTDAAGKTITATYNPRGMPLSITDQENRTATATLTARDEIATATLPGGELYTLAWTPSRMVASVTDPRGANVSFAYDERKQLASHTDPLGFTANLVRDGAGFVVRAVNALGNATDYDRDLAGRLVAVRDPDGGVASFVRGCCDLLSRTDALGTVTYGYTNRHELASITGSDVAIQYTWDPRRLLATATQSNPTPSIGYAIGRDAAGRTTSVEATHLGPRISMLVLDAEGNPVQVTTNLNPTPVAITYNNLNLPASMTAGSPPLTATLTYTPRRQIAQIGYSSGVGASYSYDPNGELSSIQEQGPSFMASYVAGYDASGNRNSVALQLPNLGSGNIQVDYELRGLPSTVTYSSGGTTTIGYNAVRDRLQLNGPGGQVTYSYTPAQRMVGAGPTSLAWNLAGGCTQLVRPSGTTTFAYRTDGALTAITQQSQSWQVVLGPLGEIARVVLPDGASRWFAYDFADRGGLIRRVIMNSPGSQATDSFIFADGIEDRASAPPPVVTAAVPLMWLKSPASQVNQRATLTDPWGSISLVADGSGNMLQARAYGIFGELLAETTGSQYIAQGYLGMDVEEGLSDLDLLGLSAIDYLSRDFQNGYFTESTSGGSFVRPPLIRLVEIAQQTTVDAVRDPFGRVAAEFTVSRANDAPARVVREDRITLFAAVRPYLSETGSFLFDIGSGPDALYAGAAGARGQLLHPLAFRAFHDYGEGGEEGGEGLLALIGKRRE